MEPMGQILEHVSRVRYEDLPAGTVEVVKKAIVDTVGAGIAGSSAPIGKMVSEMVRGWEGRKQSRVWVYGDRVPAQEAAFANAVMARCRELDDCHEGNKRRGGGIGGHIGVTVVPAVLAMAESSPAPVSGKRLILAIAVGGDIVARLRLAAGESGLAGWVAETSSPFGIVAAAAKLFDLGPELVANAMGAAYAFCSGNVLSTTDGSWDIWLAGGIGARGGMLAVDLARRGYIGSKSPLTGSAGLYPLYFRNEYHEKALLSGLGKEFEIANVSIKPYSSCKATHHGIYTVLELAKKHGLTPDVIERIEVKTTSYQMRLVGRNEKGEFKHSPRTVNEAQFSLPFTVATALIRGTVFPDVLTEESLKDAEIVSLARKVAVEATPEKDELMRTQGQPPSDVSIYTSGGKVYSGSEPFVKGHPQNPMSFDECAAKFWRCVALSARPLGRTGLARFLREIEGLEQVEDMRSLMGDAV